MLCNELGIDVGIVLGIMLTTLVGCEDGFLLGIALAVDDGGGLEYEHLPQLMPHLFSTSAPFLTVLQYLSRLS